MRHFVAEALEDLTSLDSRVVRTVRTLLLSPGQLTIRFVEGQRARFVPPFRLYLICSVVYFGVLALLQSESFFFFHPSEGSEQAARFVQLLPRLMFLILPAFALLLHLLYRRRLYLGHLIFALHYHSFAFLLLSAHTALESYVLQGGESPLTIMAIAADVALQLWVFAYLFRSLRRVYGEPKWITAAKGLVLLSGYLGILVATGAGIVQVGRILS